MWQTKNSNVIQEKLSKSLLFIVAADVKAYTQTSEEICAMRCQSSTWKFSANVREAILQLNNSCLSNVIAQFENNFYIQDKGIVTGDSHSVTFIHL